MNSRSVIPSKGTAAALVSGTRPRAFHVGMCARCESPIRILHVIDRLDVGGTEKVIAKLIKGLDPDFFQHSVCTLRGSAPAARAWVPDVEVVDAGCDAAGFQFNVIRLSKIMRTIRPTIVHSRNWGGIEGILAARYAGVPVVVHSEHGYQLDMMDGLPIRQRMMRHVAYRCASAVFAVSRELRDYHSAQAWWDAGSMRVLPNGVDVDKFCPSLETAVPLKRQLGIPTKDLVVGYIGRLVALKDVRTLLVAVEKIVSEVPEVRVVIVGSGPELDALQGGVASSTVLNGRVVFTGARKDVDDLLKCMDVFVLPSLMEGMSNTLLEAMASGLPVIATDVGGNPEIVTDSACGYLFQPGDTSGLANKLSTLLRNREMRERFGHEARERVAKTFSLEAMLARYRQLYSELVMACGSIRQTGNYVWD